MAITVATFNVENLFERPKAMNLDSWAEGQPAIDAAAKLNSLMNKAVYTDEDKEEMLETLRDWGLLRTRPSNKFLKFRKIRGYLFRKKAGKYRITAAGRNSWVGWVELKTEAIKDPAVKNTARVIAEVNPDILVAVEVENRPVLEMFYKRYVLPLLKSTGLTAHPYNMVIDGNDRRGIDVGIISRFPISGMRSNITVENNGRTVFSRDCPEYTIAVNDTTEIVVLPNHFASKGSDFTGDRRKVQAAAVKTIVERIRRTHDHVIVAGDLNDWPGGGSLDALLTQTELTDAMASDLYNGYPGTYQHGREKQKLDYLLLSPSLTEKLTEVNVFRKGFYAPTKWDSFENINTDTKDNYRASDHHCLYATIDI